MSLKSTFYVGGGLSTEPGTAMLPEPQDPLLVLLLSAEGLGKCHPSFRASSVHSSGEC